MQTTTLGSRTNHLTICLPQGPITGCETPGPGGGPGSGPGKSPARADHHVAGLGVPSARRLGGGRGESASVPSAAKGEAATVPSAAVGETTAGVAVGAAVAAILARSMGPKPITERGGEDIPGQAARTVGRRPQRSWRGQWDPSRSRSGAERESKPVGEDGAAVEDTAVVGASKPITAGDV